MNHAPSAHYDRVTAAWGFLLGEELHYGVFNKGDEPLSEATGALTGAMLDAARIEAGHRVLDVGCGTGTPGCRIASETGASVTGISTSPEGIEAANARAAQLDLAAKATFAVADGMDNGYPDASFDRVWALESSHLMRDREQLIAECARVLRPGGRLILCDIIRRRPLDLMEVRRLRQPLTLLRAVFGDARMEPLSEYRRMYEQSGLRVDTEIDLTEATRPTFDRWSANAHQHRDAVIDLIGEESWQQFIDSCEVLDGFWADGTLGYGLIAGTR